MDDSLLRLKQLNDENAAKAAADAKHGDTILAQMKTQEVIVQSFGQLVDYLDNKVTKTEVLNQLSEISTPDVAYVVSALNGLHETMKTHENTDLSEITAVMREVLEQTKQLPKDLVEIPEHEEIDYSKQFEGLTDAIKAVEAVVKAQELKVDAPVVNVPETTVNVDAPDLTPLQKGHADIVKAVKAIVIPEYKTDNKEVEKLLEKANKTLVKILDRPVGGGSGGGGSLPYVNSSGATQHVTLYNGSIPVSSVLVTERFATSGGYDYIGEAPVGSSDSSSVWTISRYDAASGMVARNVKWNDRLTETYA